MAAALQQECDTFSQHSGIPVQFMAEDLPASLPEDVSLCLYRIAQESLRNVTQAFGSNARLVKLAGIPEVLACALRIPGRV